MLATASFVRPRIEEKHGPFTQSASLPKTTSRRVDVALPVGGFLESREVLEIPAVVAVRVVDAEHHAAVGHFGRGPIELHVRDLVLGRHEKDMVFEVDAVRGEPVLEFCVPLVEHDIAVNHGE